MSSRGFLWVIFLPCRNPRRRIIVLKDVSARSALLGKGNKVDTLHIELEERPEGMVARLSGEVDLANAIHFKDAIQPAPRNCRNVILDMSNLRYIDSTGLHVLIDANKELQQNNCQLIVVGASPGIAKVMRILHLDRILPLVSSVEEAMGRIRSKSSIIASDE